MASMISEMVVAATQEPGIPEIWTPWTGLGRVVMGSMCLIPVGRELLIEHAVLLNDLE